MATKAREEEEVVHRQFDDNNVVSLLNRVPTEKPPFTIAQLKKAIPPHCFQRSAVRSFLYVVHDLLFAGALFYTSIFIFPALPSPFHLIIWPLYWAAQGCVFAGVGVIAHECGHHALSDYALLDDAVGMVLHSFLLVPYFSWKYSHRRHHANAASLDRDEVFVPKRRSTAWFLPILKNPFGPIFFLTASLTVGWPLYFLFNTFSRPYDIFTNHFDSSNPIFIDRERAQIFISNAGVLGVIYLLYRFAVSSSLLWVVRVYGAPLLVANAWHALIMFLQHTHPALPRYDSTEWDWLRGGLATVDRDYGLLNHIFHHITDTHVVHHLFPTMPHYHAVEATKAIRPILGNYYRFDDTPVVKAVWREFGECIYVEPDEGKEKAEGIFWYRKDI